LEPSSEQNGMDGKYGLDRGELRQLARGRDLVGHRAKEEGPVSKESDQHSSRPARAAKIACC